MSYKGCPDCLHEKEPKASAECQHCSTANDHFKPKPEETVSMVGNPWITISDLKAELDTLHTKHRQSLRDNDKLNKALIDVCKDNARLENKLLVSYAESSLLTEAIQILKKVINKLIEV